METSFKSKKELKAEYDLKYRAKNKDSIAEYKSKNYQENKERIAKVNNVWRSNNREKVCAISARQRRKDELKIKARHKVAYEVECGRLVYTKCLICKSEKNLQFHHHKGYEEKNWLSVVCLCSSCHRMVNRYGNQITVGV